MKNKYKLAAQSEAQIPFKLELTRLEPEDGFAAGSDTELVFHLTPDYKVIWSNLHSNSQHNSQQGTDVEPLGEQLCFNIAFGREQPCPQCSLRQVLENGRKQEYIERSADGRYWLVRCYPVLKNGRVDHIVEIITDISRLIEAEYRNRMVSKVFRTMSDAMVIMDMEGTIQFVNAAFTSITGYTPEEALGQHVDFLAPDCECENNESLLALLRKGRTISGETWLKRKNHMIFPAIYSIRTIKGSENEPGGLVLLFNDQSEQYKINQERERIREQQARMQRISLMSKLSTGVIHEIAQPLNAIKVIAEGMLLCKDLGKTMEPEEIFENLQGISDQVSRIEEIIQHMRRLANASKEGECGQVDINQAFTRALNIMTRQLQNHGIRVETSLEEGLPPVRAVDTRLEEVVVNLLTNAMEALDQINSNDKIILCRTRQDNGMAVLEISDNGVGIPENCLDQIFEPFYTTKTTGLGLGLAIVQSFVARCNGVIEVKNNELGGATFKVRIPLVIEGKE